MAKYIVETYYTCTFKVKHHLEDISNNQLDTLDNRDDGEYEILDVKFDKRNTKSLEKKSDKVEINYNESIEKLDKNQNQIPKNIVLNNSIWLTINCVMQQLDLALMLFLLVKLQRLIQ